MLRLRFIFSILNDTHNVPTNVNKTFSCTSYITSLLCFFARLHGMFCTVQRAELTRMKETVSSCLEEEVQLTRAQELMDRYGMYLY